LTTSFSDIAVEFERRAASGVWATVASTNVRGQTRVRVLHPAWEHLDSEDGPVGWVGTRRHGSLSRHLAVSPFVSVAYLETSLSPMRTVQAYADCRAEFVDDAAQKRRVWDYIASLPEPYGYKPELAWQSVENPEFGLLRLQPWRIELAALDEAAGWAQQVWRAATAEA